MFNLEIIQLSSTYLQSSQMAVLRLGFVLTAVLFTTSLTNSEQDLPCRARNLGIEGRSIVCVCDANYCDTITREDPSRGTYVVYTSSDSGKRFEKSFGQIQTVALNDPESTKADKEPTPKEMLEKSDFDGQENTTIWNSVRLRLFTNTRYQTIEGFGGSVTDAAAINWRKLSDAAQTQFINTYFGPKGLEYNMIRVPIAGADFSTHPYTYNELPWNDGALTNYSLSDEDLFLKLPMIRRSLHAANHEVKITASCWSPPIWMKTNERITGFGQVKREFYQSYADYHLRFIEEYAKANVKIWAITTTNEPINGIVPAAPFNSLGWMPSQMATWIANNLGPTIRNSPFNDTLILAVDDQRYLLHFYVIGMERAEPKAFDYIDGIAIHYYGNFAPAQLLTNIQNRYPDKILLSTEACEGAMPWDAMRVEIGSWRRARNYITSILQDLNNFVVGWIDWNLCLSPTGGPNWADNFVDSPILVYAEDDEFIKNPMFYAMGHFSKFIPRGSVRILASRRSIMTIENLAVLTPQGNMVVVLHNRNNRDMNVRLDIGTTRYIQLVLEPHSVKTIEINHN
ncbi:unnamed protein product [Chilo suppressalis]|uniref:Glucosylceramidase n=2 Tax=Chilo suppressalis TaxID=168631 RepID=A0ABN8AT41_CHISP|nr:unnamed protein product [Chilo suppressalis]